MLEIEITINFTSLHISCHRYVTLGVHVYLLKVIPETRRAH